MSLETLGSCIRRLVREYPEAKSVDAEDPRWVRRLGTAMEHEDSAFLRFCEEAGVPARLDGADFDLSRRTPAMDRVRAYMFDAEYWEGQSLLLAGPTGVGKSYAAVAALREAADRTRGFWYFPALCGQLLSPTRRDAALEAARGRYLVVFDDVGVEYQKDGGLVEAFFDEIVWHREGNYLPTIFTTNLTVEQLTARVSSRIVDRLRGWGAVYAVTGPSLRLAPGDVDADD